MTALELNKQQLNQLYEINTNRSYDVFRPLVKETINLLIKQAYDAALCGYYSVELNLKEEYKKQRINFYSPDEYSYYTASIANYLDGTKIRYKIKDNILLIEWLL